MSQTPDLVGPGREQLGLHRRRVGGVAAPLAGLARARAAAGTSSTHRRQVDRPRPAAWRRPWPAPRRRTRCGVQHLQHRGPLRARQRTRLRGCGCRQPLGIRPRAAVGFWRWRRYQRRLRLADRRARRLARRPRGISSTTASSIRSRSSSRSLGLSVALPVASCSNSAESFPWTSITWRALSSSACRRWFTGAQPGVLALRGDRPAGAPPLGQRLQRTPVALLAPLGDQRGVQALAPQQRALGGLVQPLVLRQDLGLVPGRVRPARARSGTCGSGTSSTPTASLTAGADLATAIEPLSRSRPHQPAIPTGWGVSRKVVAPAGDPSPSVL